MTDTSQRDNERTVGGGPSSRGWSRLLQLATIALLLLTSGALPQAQGRGQVNGRGRVSRVDARLADRLTRDADTDTESVIVRVRPGARPGLIRALQAQGGNVSDDLPLVEGFAGRMPAGLLRALAQHPDVVQISTDAEVTASGISSDVSGVAAGSPYTLARTLGLESSITLGTTTS
ncbi:MAG: hypothetical protein OEW19_03515, partial [Acidobacteriota bacterium]|nr:hypothetical protein [Acidobacteriota bacterium]